MSPRPRSRPAGAHSPAAASARSFRAAAGVPAFAGLAALALYLATRHRGLPAGDSGELITVAATGGVAHPPGYPLWTMLAGAWLHAFPLGSVAARLDAFSAVVAALAVALLAAAIQRATRSPIAALVGAAAFAIATPAWKVARVAEVFALNALFAACVLLALAGVGDDRDPDRARRRALACALLGALALAHHHTLLLLALPAGVATFVAARSARVPAARLAREGAIAVALGLLPLAWLPLAARHANARVWGEPETWRGFVAMLLRSEYGTFRLDAAAAGWHGPGDQALAFLRALPASFGLAAIALALVGAVAVTRRSRLAAGAIAAFAVLQAAFFTRVGFPSDVPWLRGVVERFHVLPLLVLGFLVGEGTAALLRATRGAVRLAAALALLALVLAPVAAHRRAAVPRDDAFVETLGRGLLAALPPRGGVLFVRGDVPGNAVSYLQQAEGLRPEVIVVDEELLTYGWYVRRLRARHPDLLPDFMRAERIRLADGTLREGVAIARADGTTDLLTEAGASTVPSARVVAVEPAPAESLYRATRASFRAPWPLVLAEDRYSGLPASRSLRWFDRLDSAGIATCALEPKDDSWRLRHELVPAGFAARVVPRGAAEPPVRQAEAIFTVLDSISLEPWFAATDPASLERAERWRFAALATRAALLASRPETQAVLRAHPRGHAHLLEFARRFEPLEPSPSPACLRALAYLRLFDPEWTDLDAARDDLRRWFASGDPAAARDAEGRATLAQLERTSAPDRASQAR